MRRNVSLPRSFGGFAFLLDLSHVRQPVLRQEHELDEAAAIGRGGGTGRRLPQMGLLIEQLGQEGCSIPDEEIQRVAPLMRRHISPFAQYHLDLPRMRCIP